MGLSKRLRYHRPMESSSEEVKETYTRPVTQIPAKLQKPTEDVKLPSLKEKLQEIEAP